MSMTSFIAGAALGIAGTCIALRSMPTQTVFKTIGRPEVVAVTNPTPTPVDRSWMFEPRRTGINKPPSKVGRYYEPPVR